MNSGESPVLVTVKVCCAEEPIGTSPSSACVEGRPTRGPCRASPSSGTTSGVPEESLPRTSEALFRPGDVAAKRTATSHQLPGASRLFWQLPYWIENDDASGPAMFTDSICVPASWLLRTFTCSVSWYSPSCPGGV